MALVATCNERLQSSELLLANLVQTVGFIIDITISARRQSIFYFWNSVNNLHSRVKPILRHGAKIRHHLIFSQPSFAAFDNWLEARLIDHTLSEELVRCHKDISDFYYEWALIQNKTLFDTFVKTLRVLGTQDLEALIEIEAITSEMLHSAVINLQNSSEPEMAHEPEILESKVPLEKESIDSKEVATTDNEEVSSASTLSIPAYSYNFASPISSPPEFQPVSGGVDFISSQEREEPEGCSSQETLPSSSLPKIVHASPIKTISKFPQDDDNQSLISIISDTPIMTRKAPQSFLESGGLIQPPALANFPMPQKGQSLTAFLSSLSDSNTMPELDRENAHFNVSEALISAVERLKVNQVYSGSRSPETPLVPDEMEDVFGTVEKQICQSNTPDEPDTSRKFYSGKTFPRPPILHTETEESEVEYWKQRPKRPPSCIRKKPRFTRLDSDGLRDSVISTTELSSSSSQSTTGDDFASSSFSAEHVALNLLRNAKIKEEHVPLASELKWLVSENEAPQSLLPMPKNWTATSASESEYESGKLDSSMRLRGTNDWAPPRPQIIFTIHPPPNMSILTETQKYRCAGCGVRVVSKYASTFRYCFYLGRYFCTGCHTTKKARLPQLIIHKWDFSPYLVSNFSATLLESLQSDPVYNVLAINPNLTKKVKLNNFRNYRIQLGLLHEYLKNCKAAEQLYYDYQRFPPHYANDVDLFSLEDLVNVRFSTGPPMILKEFVAEAMRHVLKCVLCKNLGFLCQICSRNEVLFPFQINRVSRCPKCSSCFHLKCFNVSSTECPKCLRVSKRRDVLDVSQASIAV